MPVGGLKIFHCLVQTLMNQIILTLGIFSRYCTDKIDNLAH